MNSKKVLSFLTGIAALAGIGLVPNVSVASVPTQATKQIENVTEQTPVFLERATAYKGQEGTLFARHYSHQSHYSHSSHRSHYSHYSSRY